MGGYLGVIGFLESKNPAGAGFAHRQAISPAAETEPAEEPG